MYDLIRGVSTVGSVYDSQSTRWRDIWIGRKMPLELLYYRYAPLHLDLPNSVPKPHGVQPYWKLAVLLLDARRARRLHRIGCER
jgi:hypothetical protein